MRDEKHKAGIRYNDEVKDLIDKGVHETPDGKSHLAHCIVVNRRRSRSHRPYGDRRTV
jgi:hypothetical protein